MISSQTCSYCCPIRFLVSNRNGRIIQALLIFIALSSFATASDFLNINVNTAKLEFNSSVKFSTQLYSQSGSCNCSKLDVRVPIRTKPIRVKKTKYPKFYPIKFDSIWQFLVYLIIALFVILIWSIIVYPFGRFLAIFINSDTHLYNICFVLSVIGIILTLLLGGWIGIGIFVIVYTVLLIYDISYDKKLSKTAKQGDAEAQFLLGVRYSEGNKVIQDIKEAVKWYRLAAEQGHADAQFNLGLCYENGDGIDQNMGEAVKWYRKVAEQGYAEAQYKLGVCYDIGDGVFQNKEEAAEWYRKAADQGLASAQYKLAICYKYGDGVAPNKEEMIKWICKAADQGYEPAIKALTELGE